MNNITSCELQQFPHAMWVQRTFFFFDERQTIALLLNDSFKKIEQQRYCKGRKGMYIFI